MLLSAAEEKENIRAATRVLKLHQVSESGPYTPALRRWIYFKVFYISGSSYFVWEADKGAWGTGEAERWNEVPRSCSSVQWRQSKTRGMDPCVQQILIDRNVHWITYAIIVLCLQKVNRSSMWVVMWKREREPEFFLHCFPRHRWSKILPQNLIPWPCQKLWRLVKSNIPNKSITNLHTGLSWMPYVSGWSWLDDKRLNGWTISRCSICTSCFYSKQSCLHRSTNKNKIWLSHYNGWRKEIKKVFYYLFIISVYSVVKFDWSLVCRFIICLPKWELLLIGCIFFHSFIFVMYWFWIMLNNTSWFCLLKLSLHVALLVGKFCPSLWQARMLSCRWTDSATHFSFDNHQYTQHYLMFYFPSTSFEPKCSSLGSIPLKAIL